MPSQLRTVLHWAIGAGHQAIVELIVKAPLGPLSRWDDSTALGEAVKKGCEAILECLFQSGAKLPSSCSDDPLIIATDQTGSSLLQLLKHGIRPKSDDILCHVARRNDITSLQLLVDFGVEIAVYGHAALFTAISWGHQAMVKFLIQQGANPHLSCAPIQGGNYSTIGYAVRCRKFDILKLLLADGVRPDYQDLQLALKLKFSEAVAILEHLSYKDVPEKMTFENCVRQ